MQCPTDVMHQFFTNTFAPQTLADPHSQASQWRYKCHEFLVNMSFVPFTLCFHAVTIVAGVLAVFKKEFSEIPD